MLLQIPEAELTLVALSPSVFFVSIASVIRGYFNGHQSMSTTANSQTLEQVAQRDWRTPIHKDTKNSSVRGPQQLNLVLLWAGDLTRWLPGSFQI